MLAPATASSSERTRRRRALESARDFVTRLCAGFPSDTPEQIAERYISHVREINVFEDAQQEIYVFDPLREWVIATVLGSKPAAANPRRTAVSPEERERRRAHRDAMVREMSAQFNEKVEERAEEIVAVRLLQYETTYGKPLGRCTGAECRRLGRRYGEFFTEVGKRLRPGEHVDEHLSELELQAIARVHYLVGPDAGKR